MKKRLKKVILEVSLVFLFFLILFVSAASNAPTNLIANQNASQAYDEGNFSVNWTSGGGDAEANYNIYVFSNNDLFLKTVNDSAKGYSFSNVTEANYTFIVEAVNATSTATNSSTNISMYVDRTPPVITLPVYTNGTFKKNSTTLTLNVSVSDVLSGLTGSVCLFDVNGTNQSVVISSNWCNISTLYLTGLNDGNQTIRVYVNDTVNILGLNDSYVVQTDTTAPTASATCSPSSVSVGASVTCNCSGTDSGSGVATSTSNSTPSTNQAGTFTYNCSVTDNVGNLVSDYATYTVIAGRGSTSTSSESVAQRTRFWDRLQAGEIVTIENFDSKIGINRIQIQVRNEVQNMNVGVKAYNTKPTGVSVEKSGKVHKYLHIETENLEQDLEKATIRIQVQKSWMENNSLQIENIAMFRFNESSEKWDELKTDYIEADENYNYYDVELGSFSYFAIGDKLLEEEGSTTSDVEEGGNLTWFWISIGIVIVIIIFIRWSLFNKNK